METMTAPNNIANIKYWGKASVELNTPTNDSVSVTLDQADLRAVTTVAMSKSFTKDRLWLNGVEDEKISTHKRFRACVDGVKKLATDRLGDDDKVVLTKDEIQSMHVHVSSYNTFPTAAGMASSAAGYAALVATLAKLMGAREEFPGQLSTVARQGSGSACRSMYGGFVAWNRGGEREDGLDSMAEQIATETHWPEIRALILVVSADKKGTSSTSGMMTTVRTCDWLQYRATEIVPKRMEEICTAFLEKDFATFGKLTMQDSNELHAACLDTYPPIFYMNDVSRSIVRLVHAYNAWAGGGGGDEVIRAAYTFDAGPNAVMFTLEEHVVELGALMLHYFPEFGNDGGEYVNNAEYFEKIKTYKLDPSLLEATEKVGPTPETGNVKKFYFTKSGPGPQSLPTREANLDPKTGLNTYTPKK
mmetsp:Transcript_8665/g.20038  ORF Transcript_8665/g.20038 Transcript_8665/m.20038 type:complete len:418 (-) Transcript_8665:232-1485(-)